MVSTWRGKGEAFKAEERDCAKVLCWEEVWGIHAPQRKPAAGENQWCILSHKAEKGDKDNVLEGPVACDKE